MPYPIKTINTCLNLGILRNCLMSVLFCFVTVLLQQDERNQTFIAEKNNNVPIQN